MKTKSDELGERSLYYDYRNVDSQYVFGLETLDDLLKRDEQREKDGFKKKITVGKLVGNDNKTVIVVPTTREEKLIHIPWKPEEEGQGGGGGSTGGEGEGEEGEVIGEKSIDEDGDGEEGEGEGEAGSGSGGDHGVSKEIYETGRVLTEQFSLPNLKDKGKKVAIPQYRYDLTDTNKKTGQVLDKKKTLKAICRTNISLGNLDKDNKDTSSFIVRPDDKIYRTLSRERMYDSQAVVFLCRDYSGSMYGKPTEAVVKQHMMIYAWLVYQYNNRVIPRFIVHDTEAKEVKNFETYYKSQVAGGTKIYSAFELVNSIIEEENMERDYNIFVMYGSDGDDWRDSSKQTVKEIEKTVNCCNRTGITVARNGFSRDRQTELEKLVEEGGLVERRDLFRLDVFSAEYGNDDRLIEGIKYLVSED